MKKIYVFLLMLMISVAWAQTDGSINYSFAGNNPLMATLCMERENNGNILVGGVNPSGTGPGIARLSSTGTNLNNITLSGVFTDPVTGSTYGSGDFNIRAICVQDNYLLIAGHFFYTIGGETYKYIIRVTPQGVIDPTFKCNITDKFHPEVIKIQPVTKKILIAGSQYNSSLTKPLYRLHSYSSTGTPGNIDTSFISQVFFNTQNATAVHSISTYSNGDIIIGGYFNKYGSTSRLNIAKLKMNGNLDTSFNVQGLSFPQMSYIDISSTAIDDSENVLIGGNFIHPTSGKKHLVRVNSSGDIDDYFTASLFETTISVLDINDIVLQPCDGKIIIGGLFYTGSDSNQKKGIARLNTTGATDTTFNSGIGITPTPSGSLIEGISKVIIDPSQQLFIAGDFSAYNNTPRNGVAKININFSLNAINDSGTITTAGGTVIANVLANDTAYGYPANSTNINLTQESITPTPTSGGISLNISTGAVTVQNGTPTGTYTLTYKICPKTSTSCATCKPCTTCKTATATITVRYIVFDAIDDAYGAINYLCSGFTFSSTVLLNDKIDGFNLYPTSTSRVHVSLINPPTGFSISNALDSSKGKITIAPGTPAGIYPITYRITDVNFPNNYDEATVTIYLYGYIDAVNDDVTVNSGVTTTNAINVLNNDTYDCHPAASAPGVTISLINNPTTGIELNTETGNISVDSTVPPGIYTLTYKICDKVFTPAYSCDTATVTITVVGPVLIDAVNDNLTVTLGSAATINVFTNDIYSGGIIKTLLSSPGGGISVNISTGLVTVPSSTPAGTYSFTYQICQQGFPSNCDTAVVTITVGAGLRTKSNHDDAVIQENSVTIYPNPSEGLFNIDFKGYDEQKFDITIHNTLGQLIYQGTVTPENTNQIDLTRFESGSYFITLLNAKETINKIVIKK